MLVYDRTKAVAPTAAFFIAAKFLPALLAPALTARVDQLAAAPHPAGCSTCSRPPPSRRSALIADSDFLLGLVLALALIDGTLGDHRTWAHARRRGGGPAAAPGCCARATR